MIVQCPNPLKPEDCAILNRLLQEIAETALLISKCKTCEIPMEQYEEMNNQQLKIVSAIKAQFFPHNP